MAYAVIELLTLNFTESAVTQKKLSLEIIR